MKVAIIGVGNMGKNHARTYSEIPEVELVGICDKNKEIGKEISNKYSTKFYGDYHRLISKEKPQVVSICVPTFMHYEIAKYCLLNRLNVLLEKPITTDIEQGKELVDIAKEKEIKFLIGHIERHNPAVKKVKEIIKEGMLGKITSIIARRVGGFPPQIKDVDIVVDLAIHDIDVINFLLDELPERVTVNKQSNHTKQRADSVELFIKYKASLAFIQANWITPVKIRKLNITGTDGYLEMDYINQNIDFYKSSYKKFEEAMKSFSDYVLIFGESEKQNIPVIKKEPLKEEIKYFLECVKKDRQIDSSFAVEALKIALTSSI